MNVQGEFNKIKDYLDNAECYGGISKETRKSI